MGDTGENSILFVYLITSLPHLHFEYVAIMITIGIKTNSLA